MASAKRRYTGALWVGLPAELGDRTQLVPGETVIADLSEDEARASDNWQPQYAGKESAE